MPIHLFKLRRLTLATNQGTGTGRATRKGRGPSMRGLTPLPAPPPLIISGITRDSAGAALGGCTVELYRRNQDQTLGLFVESTTSDGAGNFSFAVGPGLQYQHIAYKVGAPDVAGVSVRDLAGA